VPTKQIEKHLSANMNMTKRQIITANFLGGLAWGFGSVVGASVVVAIIGSILKALGVFDGLQDFFPKR
jgi:hypothetical protein